TSPIGNPWRFAEKRIDDKSGLILFGLRFYDPNVGRWISQDPARKTCADVFHYRAEWWRDLLPRLFDRAGAIREKDTIVTLPSHRDASAFDHEFMSPTYREVLWQHITNYIITKGKML